MVYVDISELGFYGEFSFNVEVLHGVRRAKQRIEETTEIKSRIM